jgi:hypothetical protein
MSRAKVFAAVCAVLLIAVSPSLAKGGPPADGDPPIVIEGFFFGESLPLREIDADKAFADLREGRGGELGAKEVLNRLDVMRKESKLASDKAPALQRAIGDPVAQMAFGSTDTPMPRQSFEGTGNFDNGALTGFVIWPPDNDGDIGRDYYVQMNNVVFEIFDKKTGATVLGPLPNVAIWSSAIDPDTGLPLSICGKSNDGDPIVLYDQQAKRWVMTQFAIGGFEDGPPFVGGYGGYQCIAVSTSSDPMGSYYLYEFEITPGDGSIPEFGLNDYPKFGIWPDGLYLSTNEFVASPSTGFAFSFQGASATAIDKWAMYAGMPANALKFFLPAATDPAESFHFQLQPSNWEGNKKPKIRGQTAPNIFIQNMDYETWGPLSVVQPDGIHHWAFYTNFRSPERSRFVDLGLIETPAFDSYGGFVYDFFGLGVLQPGDVQNLDVLAQFTMTNANYRSFGQYDAIVGNVATCLLPNGDLCTDEEFDTFPGGQIATRWFELRRDNPGHRSAHNTGWYLYQAGTWAPDADSRWMGSATMDRKGNIALGYSVSSTATFPSVRFAAREADDPMGILGTEQSCVEGTASQTAVLSSGPVTRWGDYSTINVDPKDECTFWYTNEFYDSGIDDCFPGGCWKTQICSFKMKNCGGKEADDAVTADDLGGKLLGGGSARERN